MKTTINKIITHTVNVARPEKIILFGSMARGEYNMHSDIDLLIIVRDLSEKKNIIESVTNYCREISLKADVLVFSADGIAKRSPEDGSFISAVLKAGKVVYNGGKILAF